MKAQVSLAVVGADYSNKRGPTRRFGLNLCRPGDTIHLRPEPKNPADENAIAVFDEREIQIGYLTAERASWIGGMLGKGRVIAAVFQRQTSFGAWIRIAFDGEEPILPTETRMEEAAGSDNSDLPASDFYPDEQWPD